MSDELKLLPCPFCQTTDLLMSGPVNDPPDDDWMLTSYEMTCRNRLCQACGPRQLTWEEAVTAWNNRPREKAAIEESHEGE